MSDQDPPIQGIVTAVIEPIRHSMIRWGNIGEGAAAAVGRGLRFPQFARPPELLPGTEGRDYFGRVVHGTGVPAPGSVEVTDDTLANARDAAERALAIMTRLTPDALALARAVMEYGDGDAAKDFLGKAAARVTAMQMIAALAKAGDDPDEVAVDMLNMAYAILHYGNKEQS